MFTKIFKHWDRVEVKFLLIASLAGLMHLLILPPFQSPDESNHFHRCLHIAEGNLMGEHQGKRLGGEIPEGAFEVTHFFDFIRKSPNPKFSDIDFSVFKVPEDSESKFVDFANVGYYAPTVYVPQSIGIVISKWTGVPLIYQMYIGRIFGLMFWLFAIFWAIKWIPYQKHLLAFLALLPASISIHSSLSGDIVSNALSLLLLALCLRFYSSKEKINLKNFGILLCGLSLMLLNKPTYLPICLLVFLFPAHQFSKGWIQKIALLAIPILILLLWLPYSRSLFIPYDLYDPLFRDGQQLNPGVNPEAQLKSIISSPLSFLKISLISYAESAQATWAHYIGKFGWEKNYIPTQMIALLSILGMSLIFTKEEVMTSKKPRLIFLLTGLMLILAFTVSIYMQWSPVGNDRVWSLSGRYFIGIFPFLFFVMPSFKTDKRALIERMTWVILALANFSLIYSVYIRYY